MSAFDKAWSSLIVKGVVDSVMDALYSPAIVTEEDQKRRNQEIDQILEDIANKHGITTADIYRYIDMTGHPDDPSKAVYEDVDRRREEWEQQNGKTNWPGYYVTHEGIGPDPELRRIADEWERNYDHPDGEDYLGTLNLHSQITDAMYGISGPEYDAYHQQRMGQQ